MSLDRTARLPLAMGGLRVDLLTPADLVPRILAKYRSFLDDGADDCGALALRQSGQALFRPVVGPSWEVECRRNGSRLEFLSYGEKGDFDLEAGRGTLWLTPEGDPENVLRALFAHLAVEHGGLMLHAAGVVWEQKAYLFLGHAGAGKSTVARLSPGATILGDDLALVVKREGAYRGYGVPFRGDFPEAPRTNARATLTGLYALAQAATDRIERVSPARQVAEIVSVLPFLGDPASRRKALERAQDLAQCVPLSRLHFQKSPGFWKVIADDDNSTRSSSSPAPAGRRTHD